MTIRSRECKSSSNTFGAEIPIEDFNIDSPTREYLGQYDEETTSGHLIRRGLCLCKPKAEDDQDPATSLQHNALDNLSKQAIAQKSTSERYLQQEVIFNHFIEPLMQQYIRLESVRSPQSYRLHGGLVCKSQYLVAWDDSNRTHLIFCPILVQCRYMDVVKLRSTIHAEYERICRHECECLRKRKNASPYRSKLSSIAEAPDESLRVIRNAYLSTPNDRDAKDGLEDRPDTEINRMNVPGGSSSSSDPCLQFIRCDSPSTPIINNQVAEISVDLRRRVLSRRSICPCEASHANLAPNDGAIKSSSDMWEAIEPIRLGSKHSTLEWSQRKASSPGEPSGVTTMLMTAPIILNLSLARQNKGILRRSEDDLDASINKPVKSIQSQETRLPSSEAFQGALLKRIHSQVDLKSIRFRMPRKFLQPRMPQTSTRPEIDGQLWCRRFRQTVQISLTKEVFCYEQVQCREMHVERMMKDTNSAYWVACGALCFCDHVPELTTGKDLRKQDKLKGRKGHNTVNKSRTPDTGAAGRPDRIGIGAVRRSLLRTSASRAIRFQSLRRRNAGNSNYEPQRESRPSGSRWRYLLDPPLRRSHQEDTDSQRHNSDQGKQQSSQGSQRPHAHNDPPLVPAEGHGESPRRAEGIILDYETPKRSYQRYKQPPPPLAELRGDPATDGALFCVQKNLWLKVKMIEQGQWVIKIVRCFKSVRCRAMELVEMDRETPTASFAACATRCHCRSPVTAQATENVEEQETRKQVSPGQFSRTSGQKGKGSKKQGQKGNSGFQAKRTKISQA